MPLVCLSLTARTIFDNLAVLERYRSLVDMVELRADLLDPNEAFKIRGFPELAALPCILSVRRKVDGGAFDAGEGVRLVVMAKALAYARNETGANFAYVELERDFHVPAIEESCRTFGTRIIRSRHDMNGIPTDLDGAWAELSEIPDEIPKLAIMPQGAAELGSLLDWARRLPSGERIVVGMGDFGLPSRILAESIGSSIVYASALEAGLPGAAPGHLDPATLENVYRFSEVHSDTTVYALGGGRSVAFSRSPQLHNAAFREAGFDSVYLPIPSEGITDFMSALEAARARGAAITVPFKEEVLSYLSYRSPEVEDIGACNTIVRSSGGWAGYDTDAYGFERSLLEFLDRKDLHGLRVTVMGAGGAAKAVCYVLSRLGASALVLNRSLAAGKALARRYGFAWGPSDDRAAELVADHADLIVQTTPVGMLGNVQGDPLEWYDLNGREAVYDVIYRPDTTMLLERARAAGCRTTNGWAMLRYQAAEQFRLWTGAEPPSAYYR
ncbi:MAG TPA: type I 3-dehydroquinate dehydratase [Rectinemataceae bacterium]|nr:type I 3-dehydroquinate dehydratase [Rectinemataceae bacterium]